jgi:predicted 2-oxoglutarate/Fe(II)-dependent dioxygenase YbiX
MSQTQPPLRVGDMLPAIALPGADGQPVDLAHQSIAGRDRVVLMGRPPAGAEEAVAAAGAPLVLVRHAAPDGAVRVGGPLLVFDPEAKLAARLGLPAAGGVAVFTRRGTLGFVASGEDALAHALALLAPPAPAPVRRGGAPVLVIPDLLTAAYRDALLAHWERSEKLRDGVASAAGGRVAAASIKRRADVPLDDMALYAVFQERMERRAGPEMLRAFRFRAARFEAPRIGCYDASDQGAFGAHRDNRTPYTAHRRFAMSLNLNHPGEYEGGRLRFAEFGEEEIEIPERGAAIFCCDLLHEAMPVTRGRRFAIFTFFTDAEGAKQEQELIARARASGQQGVALR